MPCLLLTLAIVVAAGLAGVPYFASAGGTLSRPPGYVVAAGSVLTFWHNHLMQSAGYFNDCPSVYWSLSVEEVFYLLLPPACLLLRKRSLIVLLCCGAIAAGPVYRSRHVDDDIYFMYGYLACFDAIAIGCLTAMLAPRMRLAAGQAAALRLGASLALAALYVRGIPGHEIAGFTLVALASAGFLLGGAADGRPPRPGVPPWFGRHSYEIDLFHIIVLAAMRNVVDGAGPSHAARLPWLAVFLALTASTAALVSRYVSEPANATLRRREGTPRPGDVPAKPRRRCTG